VHPSPRGPTSTCHMALWLPFMPFFKKGITFTSEVHFQCHFFKQPIFSRAFHPKAVFKHIFGKHNVIQSHQIENQLMTLSPNDFPCIEDYLSKFKTLRILFKECKIDMKDDYAYICYSC
jgi:hypothetical protein